MCCFDRWHCVAREVAALDRHVHVEFARRIDERRVQVAVLDAVAAAAVEMAGAAIGPLRPPDALRDLGPIDGLQPLEHDAAGRVALGRRGLVVGAGLLMADKAVDILLLGEIEIRVRPVVAGMAHRAHAFVAARVGAEIVDQIALAEGLAGLFVLVLPGPMDGLLELVPGLVMAGQACLRDLRAIGEGTFQRLVLAVIRRGIRRPWRQRRAPFLAERCPPPLASLPPGPATSQARTRKYRPSPRRPPAYAPTRSNSFTSLPTTVPTLALFALCGVLRLCSSGFRGCAVVSDCSFRLRSTRHSQGFPARRGCACARPSRSGPRREARAKRPPAQYR